MLLQVATRKAATNIGLFEHTDCSEAESSLLQALPKPVLQGPCQASLRCHEATRTDIGLSFG